MRAPFLLNGIKSVQFQGANGAHRFGFGFRARTVCSLWSLIYQPFLFTIGEAKRRCEMSRRRVAGSAWPGCPASGRKSTSPADRLATYVAGLGNHFN